MQETTNSTKFTTKDLYEASFLYTVGQRLLGLERDNQQVWFFFDDYEKCKELSLSFWSKEATVNAKAYAEAIRSLKDMLYAQR